MTEQKPDHDVAFGFRRVGETEKQGLVNEVFSKVAERYDQMKLTTDQLHKAGAAVRHSVQPSEMQLQFAFRQVRQRLHASAAQIQARLERLEAVMAKMCGTQTAAQALRHLRQTFQRAVVMSRRRITLHRRPMRSLPS